MTATNYYEAWKIRPQSDIYHNPDPYAIQHPFNALILGATGVGKTNGLMNIIFGRDPFVGSPFERIDVFLGTRSDDILYDMCEKKIDGGRFVIHDLDDFPEWLSDFQIEFASKGKKIELMEQRLVVLDDFLVGDEIKGVVTGFSTFSRKCNCSAVYLTQVYTPVPKKIRLNIDNFMLMRSISKRELLQVFERCASLPATKEQFLAMYKNATAGGELTDFLLVCLKPIADKRLSPYRKGFTQSYALDE